MSRGRPTEQPAVLKEKRVETYYQYPTKPELGWKSVWANYFSSCLWQMDT